jgi:hypothetical protein
MDATARLGPWPLRVAWLALGVVATAPAGDALDGRSTAVAIVVAVLGYGAWTAAVVALLVPRTASLTVVRAIVPAALPATVAAVALGERSSPLDVLAVVLATLAAVLALAPWTTDAFVDGSSYGPERRIALRTPPVIALLAALAWAALVAGAVAGPLLLAARAWAPGVLALLVGAGAVAVGSRSLHQLSRRWLVLVPTGLVLHDPLTMPEAQLFLRQTMTRLGPAEEGASADGPDLDGDGGEIATEDLTAGATGLAIELVLDEPVELLVRDGARGTTLRPTRRVLFTPALPGVLLTEAKRHRLPVA